MIAAGELQPEPLLHTFPVIAGLCIGVAVIIHLICRRSRVEPVVVDEVEVLQRRCESWAIHPSQRPR